MPKTLTAIGDSLTFSNAYQLLPVDHWIAKLRASLAPLTKGPLVERNLGRGGDTSAMMLGRVAGALYYDVPTIAFIYAGANDRAATLAVHASTAATTTVIPLVAGGGALLAVGAYVVIGGQSVRVQATAGDTITLATPLSAAPAAGTTIWADTRRNIVEIGKALAAGGCPRVMVIGSHYKNWSSGGDTASSEEAFYGALRVLQKGARDDLVSAGVDAVYCDTYAFQKALIGTGGIVQGDNLWSALPNNQHMGDLGHTALAGAVLAAVQAKPSFLAALAA